MRSRIFERFQNRSFMAIVTSLALTLLLSGLFVGGCTSDLPNEVGDDLISTNIGATLQLIPGDDILKYSALTITEDDLPIPEQQILYLGSEGGTSASILANIDFADIFTDEPSGASGDTNTYPAHAYLDDVDEVKLRMLRLKLYAPLGDTIDGVFVPDQNTVHRKMIKIFELNEPFDPEGFTGEIPAHDPSPLYISNELVSGSIWEFELEIGDYRRWATAGSKVGFYIKEVEGSDPGVAGFSASELKYANEIDSIHADVPFGVGCVIGSSKDGYEENLLLPPADDTSAFFEVAAAPESFEDGLMLRTCLRNYPSLYFDYSEIPDNAFINRASLRVVIDTESSFGPNQSIVVSEIDTTAYETPVYTMSLDLLDANTTEVVGQTSIDSDLHEVLEFNVTSAVQRFINGAYEGTRGFVLTAGEDFFPNYSAAKGPDFHFTQFNFFGTSAADSLRPRLKITYSLIDDFNGGSK